MTSFPNFNGELAGNDEGVAVSAGAAAASIGFGSQTGSGTALAFVVGGRAVEVLDEICTSEFELGATNRISTTCRFADGKRFLEKGCGASTMNSPVVTDSDATNPSSRSWWFDMFKLQRQRVYFNT